MNRKILILRIFQRKTTILRKILRIRLILRIRIFVNTGAVLHMSLHRHFCIFHTAAAIAFNVPGFCNSQIDASKIASSPAAATVDLFPIRLFLEFSQSCFKLVVIPTKTFPNPSSVGSVSSLWTQMQLTRYPVHLAYFKHLAADTNYPQLDTPAPMMSQTRLH